MPAMDRSDLDSLASAVASTCRRAADCAAESMQHPVETSGDFLYLNTQEERINGAASTKTFACSRIAPGSRANLNDLQPACGQTMLQDRANRWFKSQKRCEPPGRPHGVRWCRL